MMNFLRRMFAKLTIEEQRLSDLQEAEFLLLDASKQVEYYQAIASSARQTISRLKPIVDADGAGVPN